MAFFHPFYEYVYLSYISPYAEDGNDLNNLKTTMRKCFEHSVPSDLLYISLELS